MKIKRNILNQLLSEQDRAEVSILLGPRQVGKTFLLLELCNIYKNNGLRTKYYNLEIPSHSIEFNKNENELFEMLTADVDVVFIDEFHYLKNASKLFKAIYDSDKKIKIYASGSSSIEIHKHLQESLAGRRLVTRIFPLSLGEYKQKEALSHVDNYLVYGGLPGLVHFNNKDEQMRILREILETYIQKDIKSLIKEENIRAFNNLLYLIAENQGSIVQLSNLASKVGLSSKTISHHLSILENTYVIYPLHSYSRNLGNELKKSHKYFLYDNGIRNAILKDFANPGNREDKGILYESLIMTELFKQLKPNMELKFWRTKQGDEVDFVILINRKPYLIEVKTSHSGIEIPAGIRKFINKYPETIGATVFCLQRKPSILYQNKEIRFLKHEDVINFLSNYV
ncbi:MAG: ATP-binding protein [Spirochaetes bacterium]|nr:ATP-binding protein [Spirochaetota bacterium]